MAPTARRPAVLLGQANLDPARARRTLETVERSVRHLIELAQKLETVARMHNDGDNPVVQEVSSGTVVAEAARQVREMADARGVEIRVMDALPTLTIDVGRLELTFVNLVERHQVLGRRKACSMGRDQRARER